MECLAAVLLLALYHDDVVSELGLDGRVGVDRLGEGGDRQGEGGVLEEGRGIDGVLGA